MANLSKILPTRVKKIIRSCIVLICGMMKIFKIKKFPQNASKNPPRLIPKASAIAVATASLIACSPPVHPSASAAETDSIPSFSVKVDGDQHNLRYLANGDKDNGRPYIFVHGTPGNAKGWSDYLLSVPKNRYYIAVDRLGFGQSTPENAVISLDLQATAIGALLVQSPTPAVLIGHSLGGPVVAKAALKYPDKVAAIIIMAGSLDPALEQPYYIQYLGKLWPFSLLLPRPMRNANDELLGLETELRILQPELSQLQTPTIIVHSLDDSLVPYANVAFMQKQFSQAKHLEIMTLDKRDHFLPWNSFAEINQALDRSETFATHQ